MTGLALMVVFFISIIVMVLAIAKWKVHPFLAIMAVAIVLGLLAGIPMVNRLDESGAIVTTGIAGIMGQGFSSIFTGIGLVIIFGGIIGSILEVTGGAFKIADLVVKVLGKASPALSMVIMGWIVSIPVFCDSGFVILNPVRKSLVKRTGSSAVATAVGLGGGLYISHVLVPLTPGPLAAADILNLGDQLLLVMLVSIVVSIPVIITTYLWAVKCGKQTKSKEDVELSNSETVKSYEQLVKEFDGLPNGALSLAPILVPILCLALGSIAGIVELTGWISDIVVFIGTPVIALAIGLVFATILLATSKKMDQFNELTNNTLKALGPILFITGAGSVLGRVIAVSDMVPFISENSEMLSGLGLFFPFIVAAVIKTAQGSSTVAIITTTGIMAPLMTTLGMDSAMMSTLTVMAVGAGSMMASHANDSYFWVVNNLSDMTPEQGYKNWTTMSVVQGVTCMITIFVISLFFS